MRNFADGEIADCNLSSSRTRHAGSVEPPAHEVGWLFFRRMRNNGAASYKSKRGAISRTRVFPNEKLRKTAVYIHAGSARAQQST